MYYEVSTIIITYNDAHLCSYIHNNYPQLLKNIGCFII